MTWWHKWDKKEIARRHEKKWREAEIDLIKLRRALVDIT